MFKVDLLTEQENAVFEKHKQAKARVKKLSAVEKLRYKAMQFAYKLAKSLQANVQTRVTDWHLRSVFSLNLGSACTAGRSSLLMYVALTIDVALCSRAYVRIFTFIYMPFSRAALEMFLCKKFVSLLWFWKVRS